MRTIQYPKTDGSSDEDFKNLKIKITNPQDYQAIIEAIENPPEPPQYLINAFRKYYWENR